MNPTRTRSALFLLPLLAACHPTATPAPELASTPPSGATAHARSAIAWIADNYPDALARAKAQHKPLFVDAWTTWCHSCLSMQAYVFTDASLAPFADRFVWLAADTEKEQNAALTARYPVDAYPSFFVVDPSDGGVAARKIGSMTVPELQAFLLDAEAVVEHPGGDPRDPRALMRLGTVAELAGRDAEALQHYADAAATLDWPKHGEALAAQARALGATKDFSGCVDLGLKNLDDGKPAATVELASYAADCAEELPESDARVVTVRQRAAAQFAAVAGDATSALSADERSDYWRQVWTLREKLHDDAGARDAAERRLAVLEPAAAAAPDATAASTYDWARAETHLYLHHDAQAKALLAASERALPDDYNPGSRLAIVHLRLNELDEARAAIDRALPKAYGPRKGYVLSIKANILEKQGQRDAARAIVEEQLALYRALPDGQKSPQLEALATQRLESLRSGEAGSK